MLNKKLIIAILIIQAGVFLLTSMAWAQPVRDRILGDIDIQTGTEYAVIKVAFTFPVRYQGHFPHDLGNELRIRLEPIAINRLDRDAIFKRESVSLPEVNSASATEVIYEGDVTDGPYLTILFGNPVRYQVKQGADYRSILVLVDLGQVSTTDGVPQADDERSRQLQKEAVQAMSRGDFTRAVQIYTKLAIHPDLPVRRSAQELLGRAREKNGQLAHAKAEYQRYLDLYPDSDAAERVRSRLHDLRTGKSDEQVAGWQTTLYGGISQFYDREESRRDNQDRVVDRSSLDSNFDLTYGLKNRSVDLQAVLIGGHEEDFLDDGGDRTRINALYLDIKTTQRLISTRLGRQSGSSGGVLGRFDGGKFGIHLTPMFTLNLVGGFPVTSTDDGPETETVFYGVNVDLTKIAQYWNFNVYMIHQERDGLTDRQAIGGEARFTHRRASLFTLIDYDIHHNSLNTALFSSNLVLSDRTIVNLSADYRNNPSLTLGNALIGQPVDSLSELGELFDETEIEDLAKDRTAISKSATISITHSLSERLQLAADVTWTRLDDTDPSGGIDAFEGTEDEYYYALQLIGNSLVWEGDLASFGVRYADTTRHDTYSATLNTRFPVHDNVRINPKLYVDYREHKTANEEQWSLRPSLRIEYRHRRNLRLEIEGGYDWSDEQIAGVNEDTRGFFITLGYRWDF